MNPQAEELNVVIREKNNTLFEMLSDRGKNIFFPKKGILGQTADAKGKKINATIGAAVEDDGSPMRFRSIEKLLNISPSLAFPYAPSFGRPEIRKKWKEMIYEKNPSLKGIEISLPVVTNALTHALSIVGYMFINPGDTVLVSDLFWGNYNLIFSNAYGTKIEKFNLFKDDSFDLASFEQALATMKPGKKVVLLNFPNNPAGYTPTVQEVKGIVTAIQKEAEKGNQMVIIMDDAYFGLVFQEGIEKESVFAFLANLHENILTIKVDGPTKEDYVWGFRVGFITYGIKNGDKALYDVLEAKTAGAVRGNISNACNLSQSLLMAAFDSDSYNQEKLEKYNILFKRFLKVQETLKKQEYKEYFRALPFNSGYFMCVKLKDGIDGEKLRHLLLNKYDTGIINMSNVIRIAFSSVAEKDIPLLFDNIYHACKELSA
ncbi:MAG: aminotransferase class I/II-fold pyridoxal phosphate-dependent enzyme [Bacteroidales bacterium]|nr:aminotransferase class I/II-fold pyridoxal phosphate-dependent enzyme [Bacteroidales bacterium]